MKKNTFRIIFTLCERAAYICVIPSLVTRTPLLLYSNDHCVTISLQARHLKRRAVPLQKKKCDQRKQRKRPTICTLIISVSFGIKEWFVNSVFIDLKCNITLLMENKKCLRCMVHQIWCYKAQQTQSVYVNH